MKNIDFSKCELQPLDGIKPDLYYESEVGFVGLDWRGISFRRYDGDGNWKLGNESEVPVGFVVMLNTVATLVDAFIKEQLALQGDGMPTHYPPEGWVWDLGSSGRWYLKKIHGGMCYSPPVDFSHCDAMQTCIDVFKKKNPPRVKNRFRQKATQIEAFQMTRECLVDPSLWPVWFHAALCKGRPTSSSPMEVGVYGSPITIPTARSWVLVNADDYIILDDGELRRMDAATFEATYEPME
jgi:hypothetical protein